MRIAVTGASGNVGTALARSLLAHGHEVVGISRRPPGTDSRYAAVQWHAIDVTDPDAQTRLRAVFEGADAVVHLVWGFQPTHDRDYLERLDIGGTRRVIAAALAAGVPHLVHQSSLGVYSPAPPDDRPVDESWPREGIATSAYSRHKVAVEHLLDAVEGEHPALLVTRTRPVLIGQRSGASGVMRYTLPTIVPASVLRVLPVLPVDGRLRLQFVHADDVATAIRLAIEQRRGGPFNLAADGILRVEDLAAALGARHLPVPLSLLRRAADWTWRAHLQQVDVGWLDMGYSVPLLDSTRARVELGWSPRADAHHVFAEMLSGMREAAHDDTPILRERKLRDGLLRAWHMAPVARRHQP
jgi:nucleoside-diphosphate-sugar epimerase